VRLYRPFVLVFWIAIALLARVALRPGVPPPAVEIAESRAASAPLCGAHDCGCPHGVVPASCCCAGEVERVPAPPPRARASAEFPRAIVLGPAAGPFPATALESVECSGPAGGRASANVGSAPVALMAPAALIVVIDDAGWVPALPDGPAFDLEREPLTPPPRGIRG